MNTFKTQQNWINAGMTDLRAVLGLSKNSTSKALDVNLDELNTLKEAGINAKARLVATRKLGGCGSTARQAKGVVFVPADDAQAAASILNRI